MGDGDGVAFRGLISCENTQPDPISAFCNGDKDTV